MEKCSKCEILEIENKIYREELKALRDKLEEKKKKVRCNDCPLFEVCDFARDEYGGYRSYSTAIDCPLYILCGPWRSK